MLCVLMFVPAIIILQILLRILILIRPRRKATSTQAKKNKSTTHEAFSCRLVCIRFISQSFVRGRWCVYDRGRSISQGTSTRGYIVCLNRSVYTKNLPQKLLLIILIDFLLSIFLCGSKSYLAILYTMNEKNKP